MTAVMPVVSVIIECSLHTSALTQTPRTNHLIAHRTRPSLGHRAPCSRRIRCRRIVDDGVEHGICAARKVVHEVHFSRAGALLGWEDLVGF